MVVCTCFPLMYPIITDFLSLKRLIFKFQSITFYMSLELIFKGQLGDQRGGVNESR
jgi:hypothetical protein